MLLAALALLALDALVVFFLAGGIGQILRMRPRRAAAAVLAVGVLVGADARLAGLRAAAPQSRRHGQPPRVADRAARRRPTDFAMHATLETRLAYVVTGDAEVDSISQAGLQGLTLFLAQRTALEAGDPIGLDIARDELAFFPLIYWPIVPGAREALARGARRASTPT